jgi:hypothetical protein
MDDFKVYYDEEEDILYLAKEGKEAEVVEISPGVNMNLTTKGISSALNCLKHLLCLKTSQNQWRRNFRLHDYQHQILVAKKKQPPSSPFDKGELKIPTHPPLSAGSTKWSMPSTASRRKRLRLLRGGNR